MHMLSTRVVDVVEVATRGPTRGLTLCDKAKVRPAIGDINDTTTRHLNGRRLRAHHGGGSRGVVGLVGFGLIALYARGVDQLPGSRDRDVHDDVYAHTRAYCERAKAAADRARRG